MCLLRLSYSLGEFRQASDGWHILLRIKGAEHRFG